MGSKEASALPSRCMMPCGVDPVSTSRLVFPCTHSLMFCSGSRVTRKLKPQYCPTSSELSQRSASSEPTCIFPASYASRSSSARPASSLLVYVCQETSMRNVSPTFWAWFAANVSASRFKAASMNSFLVISFGRLTRTSSCRRNRSF